MKVFLPRFLFALSFTFFVSMIIPILAGGMDTPFIWWIFRGGCRQSGILEACFPYEFPNNINWIMIFLVLLFWVIAYLLSGVLQRKTKWNLYRLSIFFFLTTLILSGIGHYYVAWKRTCRFLVELQEWKCHPWWNPSVWQQDLLR